LVSKEMEKALARSKGKCECSRTGHGHNGRCDALLIRNLKGKMGTKGGWDIRIINSRGMNEKSTLKRKAAM
jgi:hypothetical protein